MRVLTLVSVAGFALLLTANPALAYLPASAVRPGDRGVGRATFAGTEVSQFDVEVLDVLRSDAATVDAFLVRIGGAEIDRIGGIAAGMRGSPLTIRGELAAVLAYALPDADPHYGYAMPAEYAMALVGNPALAAAAPLRASAALAVAGREAPFARLPWGTVSQAAAPAPADLGPLEPGSMVGIQIVRGDINVTTLGTVTEIVGDRVGCLGHKYLHVGVSEYPLVRVSVGAAIPSDRTPFLMGNPVGEPIGVVVEDRMSGCVARLGGLATLAPVSVRVTPSGRAPIDYNLECVREPELFRETAASAVIACTDGLLDRVGPGSASLRTVLRCGGGHRIDRTEVGSRHTDVGGACASEVRHLLEGVFFNPHFALPPEGLDVEISEAGDLSEARVTGCEVIPAVARPGDELLVTVYLQPYRGKLESRQVRLVVPADTGCRWLRVRAHAKADDSLGGFDPWEDDPAFSSPAALCAWLSESGCQRTIAVDLVRSPVDVLLRSFLPRVSAFDDSGELATRDVPPWAAPGRAEGLEALRGTGDVLARQLEHTPWRITGEASSDLEVAEP